MKSIAIQGNLSPKKDSPGREPCAGCPFPFLPPCRHGIENLKSCFCTFLSHLFPRSNAPGARLPYPDGYVVSLSTIAEKTITFFVAFPPPSRSTKKRAAIILNSNSLLSKEVILGVLNSA